MLHIVYSEGFSLDHKLKMIYNLEHGPLGAPGTSGLRLIEEISFNLDMRYSATNSQGYLWCGHWIPRVTCRMSARPGNGVAGARIAGPALDWTSFEEVSAAYRDATLHGDLLRKFSQNLQDSTRILEAWGNMSERWEETSSIMAKAIWLLGRECPIARQWVSITVSEARSDYWSTIDEYWVPVQSL